MSNSPLDPRLQLFPFPPDNTSAARYLGISEIATAGYNFDSRKSLLACEPRSLLVVDYQALVFNRPNAKVGFLRNPRAQFLRWCIICFRGNWNSRQAGKTFPLACCNNWCKKTAGTCNVSSSYAEHHRIDGLHCDAERARRSGSGNHILAQTNWQQYWSDVSEQGEREIDAYEAACARSLASASKKFVH